MEQDLEHIKPILERTKTWTKRDVDREREREENIAQAARDFDYGPGPGLVEYIRDLQRRQEADEAAYDFSGMLWQLAGIAPTPDQVFDRFELKPRYPSLKAAHKVAQEWTRHKSKPFLTLAGPPGVGKTFLAVAATQELITRGELVMYRRVTEMLEELRRDTFERHSSDTITDLRQVPFLIIDDLGVQKSSDWSLEALDDIIDFRYSLQRDTMVCTNAKSEDLPPRIADRLGDVHIGDVIQISAPSHRGDT